MEEGSWMPCGTTMTINTPETYIADMKEWLIETRNLNKPIVFDLPSWPPQQIQHGTDTVIRGRTSLPTACGEIRHDIDHFFKFYVCFQESCEIYR